MAVDQARKFKKAPKPFKQPKLTLGRIVRTEHGGAEVPAIVVAVKSETVVDLIAFTPSGCFARHDVVLRSRPGVHEDEDITWWWPEDIVRFTNAGRSPSSAPANGAASESRDDEIPF